MHMKLFAILHSNYVDETLYDGWDLEKGDNLYDMYAHKNTTLVLLDTKKDLTSGYNTSVYTADITLQSVNKKGLIVGSRILGIPISYVDEIKNTTVIEPIRDAELTQLPGYNDW